MHFIRGRTCGVEERAGTKGGEMILKRYMWLCLLGQQVLILFCKAGEPKAFQEDILAMLCYIISLQTPRTLWEWT